MKSLSAAVAAVCALALGTAPLDQKGVDYSNRNGHPLLLDLHVADGPGPFPAAMQHYKADMIAWLRDVLGRHAP